MTDHANVLQQLMTVIEDRKANPPDKSYTTQLFHGGVDKIGAKIDTKMRVEIALICASILNAK